MPLQFSETSTKCTCKVYSSNVARLSVLYGGEHKGFQQSEGESCDFIADLGSLEKWKHVHEQFRVRVRFRVSGLEISPN